MRPRRAPQLVDQRRQHIVEQLAGALVAGVDLSGAMPSGRCR